MDSGVPLRPARSSARGSSPFQARRLGSPVSSSVTASSRTFCDCTSSWVSSCDMRVTTSRNRAAQPIAMASASVTSWAMA